MTSKRGFASLSPEQRKEVARKGGLAVCAKNRSFSRDRELAASAGRKGGQARGGNFANDPERAIEAGRKGGSK